MKFIYISSILIIIAFQLKGQNSFSGTISVKESGQPLPGAIVYFPDLKQGTVSNPQGKFQFYNLPAGNFLVEIKSMGYRSYITNVQIKGQVTLDVSLEESAVEMNEVVVTGSVASTQKLLSPIPTYSLNQQALQRNSSTNLIDGLSKVPGISQISTGPAISKPIIRGLGYNRVLVLHDDIRQEGQQWGDEHGVEIDENSIDKIEIVKGPGSLVYGSDALAGVLNFISTPTLPEGEIQGKVFSNFQSNNKMMDYSAVNQGNIYGINWLIRGSYKQAGNYRNRYDGLVYNSGSKEKDLNGYLGLTKSWGYSFLRFSTFHQELGLIEGERDSSGNFLQLVPGENNTIDEISVNNRKLHSYDLDIPRQAINHIRTQLNSKFLLGAGSIQTDIGFQQNTRKEFSDPLAPSDAELYFLLKTLNYDLKYNLPEINGWRNIAGLSGMSQFNSNKGEEQLIPDYSLNDIGVFVTTQKSWKELHFSGGFRFDNRFIDSKALLKDDVITPAQPSDYKFESFSKKISNVSVGAGISYNLSASSIVKINFSRGFRAPNLAELATNGKHEGTFRYEYGNRDLKSETSSQADAGFSFTSHHLSLEINAFVNNVQQYIYLKKLSSFGGGDSIPDPSDPAPAFKYTQGNALLYGGEISMDIHPHPYDYLHFQQSFSLVRGILKGQEDSTRNLPFIPAPNYQGEIRIQPIKIGKRLKNPYALVEYNYYFEQNNVYSAFGTETPTSDYGLFNLGLGSDVYSNQAKHILSVHFLLSNIFNVAYQSHLSRLKYAPENLATHRLGIFNQGRNFSINVTIPITFRSTQS